MRKTYLPVVPYPLDLIVARISWCPLPPGDTTPLRFLLEGSGRFWRRHSSALPAGGFWKGQWGFIPGRFFGGGDDIDDDFGWSYSSSTPSPSGDIAVALPAPRAI